jgi:predicted dehydrogenase
MGSRGRDWAREIVAAPAYELAGCVDPSRQALAAASDNFGIPQDRCLTDAEGAMDKTPCDLVVVACPVEDHQAACVSALSREIAVLVEKPFAMNLADARSVAALAGRVRRPLIVAQNYRYMRAFRTVRRVLQGDALGPVGLAHLHYYRVPHEMASSLARSPHAALMGVAIHHLDLLRYLLPPPVTGVLADTFTIAPTGQPGGASLEVLLVFGNGARASYSATYESSGHEYFEGGQEFYARFVGEGATLHVFHRWLVLCERSRLPRVVFRGRRQATEERVLLDQMERALATGEPPESSGRDNLQTMAVVDACLRSAAERRWIDPRELLDEPA